MASAACRVFVSKSKGRVEGGWAEKSNCDDV